ncbi:MAG: hypothetical protein VX891_04575 [Candidatus Thermoplasmatota archaeon]|nr:hypothetical protein [Candidatus Thermoplasmatota archaeon]
MEVDTERLVVALPPDDDDRASSHASGVLSQSSQPPFVHKQAPSLHDAASLLHDGHVDLLVASAQMWGEMEQNGLTIAACLQRREPTWVMVSDDKPEMLHHEAKVGCDHPLLERQLTRLRPDLVLINPRTMNDAWDDMSGVERTAWYEQTRQRGTLEGYVIPRSLHRSLPGRPPRRHTLGLHRDDPTRPRFVPPPLGGLTLLISRSGFPNEQLKPMSDAGALLAHRIERAMLAAVPAVLRPITGIHVERRRPATLLMEAAKVEDEHTLESMLDPEASLKTKGHRVEIIIETLGAGGRGSASSERVFPVEHTHTGMVRALEEWSEVLQAMTSEHAALVKGAHFMGEFEASFSEAHGAMMRLEDG